MRLCPECNENVEVVGVEKSGEGQRYVLDCGHGSIIQNVDEIVSILESIVSFYDWEFDFAVGEGCQFNSVKGLKDVEFRVRDDESGNKLVDGFITRVKASTEEDAYIKATTLAKRLTDLLAVCNGIFLQPILKRNSRMNPDQSRTNGISCTTDSLVGWDISLDLTKGELSSLIKNGTTKNTPELAERLHHANQGFEAQNNKLYEVMIREFFLVIDGVFPEDSKKYESLRDALSHRGQLRKTTQEGLIRDFGQNYFQLLSNGAFDHGSPQNIKNLKVEAIRLKEIAMRYMLKNLF